MTTTIAELDKQMESLQKLYEQQEADQQRIDAQRRQISLDALGGENLKAQRELDRLTRDKQQKELEKENVRFAIDTAQQKKMELQQKERDAENEKRKMELLAHAKERLTLAQQIDSKLDELQVLFLQHSEIVRNMNPLMGGNSGIVSRWHVNMVLKHKGLNQFIELPIPPAAGRQHFTGFTEKDRGVMSRKGIQFTQTGNPKDVLK